MSGTDPYRDWDGAYVLGSLSPEERVEYEQHLTTCDDCARDVVELADLGGILSAVPADRALALVDGDPATPARLAANQALLPKAADETAADQVPPALLPKVIQLADRASRRRRRNAVVAAVIAAAACVALAVTLVLPRFLDDSSAPPAIVLAQTVPSPITAEAQLVSEPWGTRIEVTCWYSEDLSPAPGVTIGGALPYDLYITDTAGVTTKQASWAASPGMVATPSATTQTPVDQIASIDIRVGGSDFVLLQAEL